MNKQSGFTLIELVMVIVILGVLAVTALPKFVDLKGDAQQAAVDGIAGALASASAINYSTRLAKATNGVAVLNCTTVGPLLLSGLPTGYTITAAAVANGASVNCTVTGPAPGAKTATFTVLGIT